MAAGLPTLDVSCAHEGSTKPAVYSFI